MKSMKKLVLAGFVLLASVVILAGCKNDSVPEVPKYTVTFDKNAEDATGEMTPQTFTQGEKKELTANAFERPTWTFSGWSTNKEAATPEYGNQAQFSATKDTTLYAIWTDNGTVTPVTFTSQDGTKFFYGAMVTVTLATATEGATIHYQLGEGKWKIYEKPFTVSSETVVTAYATKDGLKDSEKTNSNYLRQLISITVTPPSRTVYSVGDEFAPTGMEVTANYDDGNKRPVEGTITSETSSLTESAGVKDVIVSYKEGDTRTATFTVVVFPEEVKVLTDYKSPNGTGDEYIYVEFGEWPQTKANVEGISLQQVDGGRGYFKDNYYTDGKGNYYVKAEERAYNTGDEYKYSDGTQAMRNGTGTQWFKVEPIVWRVLNAKDGKYNESENPLLLAENILTGGIKWADSKNNYQESNIRKWLNGNSSDAVESNYDGDAGFLQTAFTPDDQKLIAKTIVDNSTVSTTDVGQNLPQATKYVCRDTTDKIFLLSEQEATMSDYGFSDNTRIRVTTDYAKATGALQSVTAGYGGWWWLRSPIYDSENLARLIYSNGYASYHVGVARIEVGIVPALSISLQ